MVVTIVPDDSRFQVELTNAANSLAVVDFTASWCAPCQMVAPIFEQLSNKYTRGVVFLKVDVDQCPESAHSQGVNAMPTFMFYRNKVKVATIQGANPTALETKIRELLGDAGGDQEAAGQPGASSPVPGHIDLNTMLLKPECECLNESDDHTLTGCLTSGSSTYLESDVDEQLIINLTFSQIVKLHSIKISAPADKGPKTIKLFINQPRTLDFDQAESMEPVQTVECSPKDLSDSVPIPLRYVKFQNVHNLLIFVKDNQGGCETTRIDHLSLIGSPVSSTNMSELKRVAGKKGESH